MLINFDNCKEKFYEYGGRDEKRFVIYNHSLYMLKFENKLNTKKEGMSDYRNNVFSEYISCKIIKEIFNIDVQDVLLGEKDKKLVVACKIFNQSGEVLSEFKICKSSIGFLQQHKIPELKDILFQMKNNRLISRIENEAIQRFWITFVIDAILANFDRHTGNWGYLTNGDNVRNAPIYDCGSCLFSKYSDFNLIEIEKDKNKQSICLSQPICNFKINNKKLTYFEVIKTLKDNENLIQAFNIIKEKFNKEKIYNLLNELEVEIIGQKRIDFYYWLVVERFNKIDEIMK